MSLHEGVELGVKNWNLRSRMKWGYYMMRVVESYGRVVVKSNVSKGEQTF
jgi:hypothetical protein